MKPAEAVNTTGQLQSVNRWDVASSLLTQGDHIPAASIFRDQDVRRVADGLFLWDIWPIQLDNGDLAKVAQGDLWIMLSAPQSDNPEDRHDHARMRLIYRVADQWTDCGNLLPDGFAPGSREWSGSARLDPATGIVTLWFTAAGRPNDAKSFEQRLFHTSGILDTAGSIPQISGWTGLMQSAENDGSLYADLSVNAGVPGMIKGFRDPYWFRDPADGQGYLLFTGSKPAGETQSGYDGVIGLAVAQDSDGLAPFKLMPPIVDAEGQVSEMERPHVIVHDGLYYLFWSSQQHVFAPGGLRGPTALYGMVAPSLLGPYEPLNATGLVLANPPSEPLQAYAWQVIPGTLEIASFVNYWGLQGREIDAYPGLRSAQFGGTIAPFARIALSGATSKIVSGGA
jgi:levansucrase